MKKKIFQRAAKVCAGLTASVMMLTSSAFMITSSAATYNKSVTFNSFPANVNGGEPIRGVDISSILSIEQAGVVFHDDNGKEEDIFRVLYDHDVNYIRVRVWNEPNDGKGHSYGGGNNDVNAACEIGRRAAKYGIKLLVDIQYSDFWADPSKQTRPKYWAPHDQYTLSGEIYKWTTWVLKAITEAGGDIGMVQVGNETECFFCGEKDMYKICELFASGEKAVRDFDRNILIAHHFANPSHVDYFNWYAKVMNECNLDYDVFATSYYPYWHGSLSNLTSVLKTIGDTYGKYVMVAETAYPYTSENGDSFGNTISAWSSGVDLNYDISVQGQTQAVTDVFQAIANCGDKGIGAFYWEPAWLGVSGTSSQQRNKWDKYGCGWASSYASEYDHDVTSAGGSSFDNQALFDFNGYPLESLDVFTRIYPKKDKPYIEKDPVTYPTNINVTYNQQYHQVRFTWDKVEGADRYGIAVYLAGKWRIQSQNITGTVYTTPKNLTPGLSYKVAIAARVNGKWDTLNAIKNAVTVSIR
ncbi:glycosyl hydrolase 53 family protein [Ruminococcus albus]|uniref:Arabinogalactan endo-beta-1,4-galactanase n=1 Tax=Ruminococcus albus TaxID=1264 RepID=A0A1H7P3T9_RUMAL|nr:glycosyl hydrolase 53 family protein [Ruminococcus albus]SEL29915.1 arabinogalactan endo-1,4-beta-galactosidase [Ruminococcus albus]